MDNSLEYLWEEIEAETPRDLLSTYIKKLLYQREDDGLVVETILDLVLMVVTSSPIFDCSEMIHLGSGLEGFLLWLKENEDKFEVSEDEQSFVLSSVEMFVDKLEQAKEEAEVYTNLLNKKREFGTVE